MFFCFCSFPFWTLPSPCSAPFRSSLLPLLTTRPVIEMAGRCVLVLHIGVSWASFRTLGGLGFHHSSCWSAIYIHRDLDINWNYGFESHGAKGLVNHRHLILPEGHSTARWECRTSCTRLCSPAPGWLRPKPRPWEDRPELSGAGRTGSSGAPVHDSISLREAKPHQKTVLLLGHSHTIRGQREREPVTTQPEKLGK
jgi:hypothetical protein